eukprot:47928-Alexandrium_andersonii.AAC.1
MALWARICGAGEAQAERPAPRPLPLRPRLLPKALPSGRHGWGGDGTPGWKRLPGKPRPRP